MKLPLHALALALALTLAGLACTPNVSGADDGGSLHAQDACTGLQCQQNWRCPGGAKTRITGTVYAPEGTLPLPNINVFVPNAPLAPFPTELTCDRCDQSLSGNPVVLTTTNVDGTFTLDNAPSGSNIPLVIAAGRWRRQFVIPSVTECVDNDVSASVGALRLPRTQQRGDVGEGDIPRMAVTTGGWDALECLVRRMGIADSEFGPGGGAGRVHLYRSNGTDRIGNSPTQTMLPLATDWWGKAGESDAVIDARLGQYDIIVHSCEGSESIANKPLEARRALRRYADHNGRVFMSHYHHTWIEFDPTPDGAWSGLLKWTTNNHAGDLGDRACTSAPAGCATIDQGFAKGRTLASWLSTPAVCGGTCNPDTGSPLLGYMKETAAKNSANGFSNPGAGERWIYLDDGSPSQFISANTPVGAPSDTQCGRIVFSDVHVSFNSSSAAGDPGFPGRCSSAPLTPQEKALIFLMFDLASCVGPVIP